MRKVTNPSEFRKSVIVKFSKDGKLKLTQIQARNIEIGIYNFTIKEAGRRNVVKKWDNPYFVNIYFDRWRSIYTNLINLVTGSKKFVTFLIQNNVSSIRVSYSQE